MSAFDPICGSALAELVARECPESTAEERAIIAHWIQLRSVAIEDVPDAHMVWLVFGDHRFRLHRSADTQREAAGQAWRLGRALLQLIATEAPKRQKAEEQ